MIERQIIIGLITSTDYLQRIVDRFNIVFLESPEAKRIASWAIDYFNKYRKAPGKDIQTIFISKTANDKFPKSLALGIENILESLSEEFEENNLNIEYLITESINYFNQRNLTIFKEEINNLIDDGKIDEAELKALSYKPIHKDSGNWIDLSNENVLPVVENAFNESIENLIQYPGPLGEMWNDQLVRGALVAIMASEKRGKTFRIIEMALRAAKQGRKVAFFSAGDMTNNQLITRIAVNLAAKSNKKKFAGEMYHPIKDCVLNQTNQCQKRERLCDFGIFDGKTKEYCKNETTLEEMIERLQDYPDYTPCTVCDEYNYNAWGCSYIKKIDVGNPLTAEEAKEVIEEFFIKRKRKFKISSHPSGTFTVKQSLTIMELWEKEDNFVPDVILYDYPDIMTDEVIHEFRHMQNKIWMDLRGVSQKKNALVILVSQADADSYTQYLLKMKNFSEDKRKLAHPTAFYALNQDKNGRDKKLGIMRINEIAIREGDFDSGNQVYVLQNMKRGLPFLTSYW